MRRRVVAGVSLLVLTACSDDQSSSGSTTTTGPVATTTIAFPRTVTVHGLTFTLPDELQFRTDGFASSFAAFDGYYANFALGPACVDGTCGSFAPLPANGVVVGLGNLPGPGLHVEGEPNTSVAGQPSVRVQHASTCAGTASAGEMIQVEIRASDDTLLVEACVSGPDRTIGARVVQALVDSAVLSG